MEQLNRIELRGNVGTVRGQEFNGAHVGRISIATNYVYKDREGNPVIETTWHNVCVWEGRNFNDFREIRKGAMVCVEGRLRNIKYTASDGTDRHLTEVLANRLNIVRN